MRANLAEIKNSMSQMQSKLEALMARVTEAEEHISELDNGLAEERAKIESGLKNSMPTNVGYGRSLTQ